VAIVKQLCVRLENHPGALAELCSELAKRAVNISGIQGSDPQRNPIMRLLVHPIETAKKICDSLNIPYYEESVIAIHLVERPGALGRVTRKLSEKGINVEYIYGSIERGARRALVILGVSDLDGAARVLK
jgi:hypothetical protein